MVDVFLGVPPVVGGWSREVAPVPPEVSRALCHHGMLDGAECQCGATASALPLFVQKRDKARRRRRPSFVEPGLFPGSCLVYHDLVALSRAIRK